MPGPSSVTRLVRLVRRVRQEQLPVVSRRHGVRVGNRVHHQFGQVDRGGAERPPLVQPGEQQQVLDQTRHPDRFGLHPADGIGGRRRQVLAAASGQLGLAPDRSERGAQLVAGIRDEQAHPGLAGPPRVQRRSDSGSPWRSPGTHRASRPAHGSAPCHRPAPARAACARPPAAGPCHRAGPASRRRSPRRTARSRTPRRVQPAAQPAVRPGPVLGIAQPAGFNTYPAPRRVWIIGSRPASTFLRRYEMYSSTTLAWPPKS